MDRDNGSRRSFLEWCYATFGFKWLIVLGLFVCFSVQEQSSRVLVNKVLSFGCSEVYVEQVSLLLRPRLSGEPRLDMEQIKRFRARAALISNYCTKLAVESFLDESDEKLKEGIREQQIRQTVWRELDGM